MRYLFIAIALTSSLLASDFLCTYALKKQTKEYELYSMALEEKNWNDSVSSLRSLIYWNREAIRQCEDKSTVEHQKKFRKLLLKMQKTIK